MITFLSGRLPWGITWLCICCALCAFGCHTPQAPHLLFIATFQTNNLREILFGWKSPVSTSWWSSGGALLGPSFWRADWRTMPRLPVIFYYSNYLPSSFVLRNSFSSPSLSPSSPLFHPQLLVLSHSLFPNSHIPAHKNLDSSFYHSGPENPYFQLILC